MSPSEETVTLAYGSFRVVVRCQDPGHLAWLVEFLAPWFEVGGDGPPDAIVTLAFDPAACRAARARAAREAPAAMATFALDTRVLRHPAWKDPERLTVLDPEFDALYRVARHDGEVAIAAGGSVAAARVALMRVVRELTTLRALRDGALLFHAAALAVRGQGILLVGGKRAGKTTLLLRALAVPGARFVANDRVVVPDGERTVARGMPSIVSVRADTLARLEPLAARLRALGYRHAVTLAEAQRIPASLPAGQGADLSPAQLCALLGVAPASEVQVRAILFPRATAGGPTARPERVRARDALPHLRAGLLGGDPPPVSEVFAWPGPAPIPGPEAIERGCRTLLARVPAVSWAFDPATLDEDAAQAAVDAALSA